MGTKSDKPGTPVEELEQLVDKAAEADDAAAEQQVQSLAGQRALRELQDHTGQVLREARRRALEAAADSSRPQSASVPARIAAMTREAIAARLDELRSMFGSELAVQYRDLETQSIDDLRSLLADLEARLEDEEA